MMTCVNNEAVILKRGIVAESETGIRWWLVKGVLDDGISVEELVALCDTTEAFYGGPGAMYYRSPYVRRRGKNKTLVVQMFGLDV